MGLPFSEPEPHHQRCRCPCRAPEAEEGVRHGHQRAGHWGRSSSGGTTSCVPNFHGASRPPIQFNWSSAKFASGQLVPTWIRLYRSLRARPPAGEGLSCPGSPPPPLSWGQRGGGGRGGGGGVAALEGGGDVERRG